VRIGREKVGIDIPDSKMKMIENRFYRRLNELDLSNYQDYLDFLQQKSKESQQEMAFFIEKVTTHETFFFREPVHLEYLKHEILPHFASSNEYRVWSAGCSTGEESYTLAILLKECLRSPRWFIDATDIAQDCIDAAKLGVYGERSAKLVPKEYLKKYFLKGTDKADGKVMVKDELKRKIDFSIFNLMMNDYGVNRYNLIFCRNVLIYFDNPTKCKIVHRLSRALKRGGYIIIGNSEKLRNFIPDDVELITSSIGVKK
jgi:chemotaxis protein methyltransferase CheR